MKEHRIVLVIAATYRTDDPALTTRLLVESHYAITSKRAQASPAPRTYALTGEPADQLTDTLENFDAQ